MPEQKTVVIVQHVGSPFFDPQNPADQKQIRKIGEFVESMRKQGSLIIHSPVKGALPDPEDDLKYQAQRSPGYRNGDRFFQNYDGVGTPELSDILSELKQKHPDLNIIMTGPYYEACNRNTAAFIRKQGFPVSSPRDLSNTDAMDPKYNQSAIEMQELGIETKQDSEKILLRIQNGERFDRIPETFKSETVDTMAPLDADDLEADLQKYTDPVPDPAKQHPDSVQNHSQSPSTDNQTPSSQNSGLSAEREHAIRAILDEQKIDIPDPSVAARMPTPEEIAKNLKDYESFRKRNLEEYLKDIDNAQENGTLNASNARIQKQAVFDEFLNHTSPEQMEKRIESMLTAEMVDQGLADSPESGKSLVQKSLADFKDSPEYTQWKEDYESRRQNHLNTGKVIKGHLPESGEPPLSREAKILSERVKALSLGEELPARVSLATMAAEIIVPQDVRTPPSQNAFDRVRQNLESIRRLDPAYIPPPDRPPFQMIKGLSERLDIRTQLDRLANLEEKIRGQTSLAPEGTLRHMVQTNNLEAAESLVQQNKPKQKAPEIKIPENVAASARALPPEPLRSAQDLVMIRRGAQGARFGGNIPMAGSALAAGAAGLIHMAHGGQRDYATDLRDRGLLSANAYTAYVEMNEKIENVMHADNAVGLVDPTGASIIATAGVEVWAMEEFKSWAETHAPHLSQDDYDALSTSLFTGNSARTEFLRAGMEQIPSNKEGQPAYLHAAIDAKKAHEDANKTLDRVSGEFLVDYGDIKETIHTTEKKLLAEMDSLLSNPEHARKILKIIPVDDQLEYARKLAQSEPDSELFSKSHPDIAAYTRAHENSSFLSRAWGLPEEKRLTRNPDSLNTYIASRTAGTPVPPSHDSQHTHAAPIQTPNRTSHAHQDSPVFPNAPDTLSENFSQRAAGIPNTTPQPATPARTYTFAPALA